MTAKEAYEKYKGQYVECKYNPNIFGTVIGYDCDWLIVGDDNGWKIGGCRTGVFPDKHSFDYAYYICPENIIVPKTDNPIADLPNPDTYLFDVRHGNNTLNGWMEVDSVKCAISKAQYEAFKAGYDHGCNIIMANGRNI